MRLIADGYVQAGVVGIRARDPFVDGALRLAYPVGKLGGARIGAGIWGAAQPGLERVDLGPQLVFPLRVRRSRIVAAIEGRVRVAGKAAPGSGIALTLGTDF